MINLNLPLLYNIHKSTWHSIIIQSEFCRCLWFWTSPLSKQLKTLSSTTHSPFRLALLFCMLVSFIMSAKSETDKLGLKSRTSQSFINMISGTQPHPFTHTCFRVVSLLWWQTWLFAVQNIRVTNPEMFAFSPFVEKFLSLDLPLLFEQLSTVDITF